MRTDRKIRWMDYCERTKKLHHDGKEIITQDDLNKIKIECGIPTYIKGDEIVSWLEGRI